MGKQVDAGFLWGCSSVGRAPALQAGGHEFESHHLHCATCAPQVLWTFGRVQARYKIKYRKPLMKASFQHSFLFLILHMYLENRILK